MHALRRVAFLVLLSATAWPAAAAPSTPVAGIDAGHRAGVTVHVGGGPRHHRKHRYWRGHLYFSPFWAGAPWWADPWYGDHHYRGVGLALPLGHGPAPRFRFDEDEPHEPTPAPSASPAAFVSPTDGLVIRARRGQGATAQSFDRIECERKAIAATGFEPTVAAGGEQKKAEYVRAVAACLDGKGYEVR
jgi:hypothetical protein